MVSGVSCRFVDQTGGKDISRWPTLRERGGSQRMAVIWNHLSHTVRVQEHEAHQLNRKAPSCLVIQRRRSHQASSAEEGEKQTGRKSSSEDWLER